MSKARGEEKRGQQPSHDRPEERETARNRHYSKQPSGPCPLGTRSFPAGKVERYHIRFGSEDEAAGAVVGRGEGVDIHAFTAANYFPGHDWQL